MIKNMLPKSPLAAAGIGLLLGVGVAGIKGWMDVKRGDASQKDAVANALKQGLVFSGVAAASTLAGGSKGGGAGLATMAFMGLSNNGGATLPNMLLNMSGSGGGGRGSGGGGRGSGGGGGGRGQGQQGNGDSTDSMLDTVTGAISEILVSAVSKKEKKQYVASDPSVTSDKIIDVDSVSSTPLLDNESLKSS